MDLAFTSGLPVHLHGGLTANRLCAKSNGVACLSVGKSRTILRMVGEAPAPEATIPVPNVDVDGKMETPEDMSLSDIPPLVGDDLEELGIDPSEIQELEPPQPYKNAMAIEAIRLKFRRHENDCGSPEYQIATLTTKIAYLTEHLKKNRKDYSSTRGLRKMVSTRMRLLKYVKKQDKAKFDYLITELGIRVSSTLRNF